MKRALSLLLAISMLLALTACGSKTAEAVPDMDAAMTMSEYLSSGQRIWYYVDESGGAAGKDSHVRCIFITEASGTLLCAEEPDKKLGELARMSDDDVILLAQDIYEDNKAREQSEAGDTPWTEELRYKLSVMTAEELLWYQYPGHSEMDIRGVRFHTLPVTFEVGSSHYSGFKASDDRFLVTRAEDGTLFKTDPVGMEGIPLDVDYANAGALFD